MIAVNKTGMGGRYPEETPKQPTSIDGKTIPEWVRTEVMEMMPEIVEAVRIAMQQETGGPMLPSHAARQVTSWTLVDDQLALNDDAGKAYLLQWTQDQLLALADQIREQNRETG